MGKNDLLGKVTKTKDKTLEVHLFDNGSVEIESGLYKNIGIEIKRADPTKDVTCPEGALYVIETYRPEEKSKAVLPGFAWIMPDGRIYTK
jgi:hypothetical protein